MRNENNPIKKHLRKWVELCSFFRLYPDVFYDFIKPKEGKQFEFDMYQRVMMRVLVRFVQCYFCLPRGASKTMIEIMALYAVAIFFPNIKLSVTASTKESAVKIWKEKHDEILKFFPAIKNEIVNEAFAKDTGRVEFKNGSQIDNLANAQSSKGLRRHRGSLEESALIDKDLYDDALEPIFNTGRTTMTGADDPAELNGQINRFSTSGYKNSDEYEVSRNMIREMYDLKGTYVFGSDWFLTVHYNRQKKSVIDKARKGNIVRFRQNYLSDWIGASNGALLNISKLIKARTISVPELECPKDKNGNYLLNEYCLAVDVARSDSDSNNKTIIVVLKIIRNNLGSIRQVQAVNIISPPNGLNFKEQSTIVKRVFYKYGGSLDLSKSRVKAVIIDVNGVGKGLLDYLLDDTTDPETNEELGCWATINTNQKPSVADAPPIVYGLTAQGINDEIITQFLNYVESEKLKLVKPYEDIKDELDAKMDKFEAEVVCLQTQLLLDEVSNLRLKKLTNSMTVEQVVKRIDKDRYSALAYGIYYISSFLDRQEQTEEEDDYMFFMHSGF